ncbi:MAG: single-stranded DNA-binding protein [Myxococcota bacterium]|jgi:single-strand DNA-binding protein|nr:single-stranded DNA-binding protein [Myxococcota bacterium]
MASLNRIFLIGNVGGNVELRSTASGTTVANFSLATDYRRQRPDGGTEVETEWHKIVTFGRQAELSRDFVSKGRLLYVEGRLQSQKWQDAQGVARRSFEVVADRVVFLERKPAEAGVSGRSGGTEPSAGDAAGAGAQDVPF